MIINKVIAIYFFLLFVSIAVGLVGAGIGLSSLIKWKKELSHEKRNAIEEKLYLSMSAIFLGVCIRVVMLPIWFYMLQGLIPVVPGAMCLSGIHQNVPFYSWIASALKLVLPFLYLTWLTVSFIDRKNKEQPFLKLRHLFLIPLVVFLLVESFFDIAFITSLKPIPVPCCTALFDMGSDTLPDLFTDRHWYFVGALLAVLIAQLAVLSISKFKITTFLAAGFLSIAIFILLPLAHHTQLSPLLLETPFHHCVFCLLQNKPAILLGTILVLFGVYFSFSYAVVGLSAIKSGALDATQPSLKRLKWFAITVLVSGSFILGGASVFSLIRAGGSY